MNIEEFIKQKKERLDQFQNWYQARRNDEIFDRQDLEQDITDDFMLFPENREETEWYEDYFSWYEECR